MKNLLLRQYQKYPAMQIQDMVKLIYQNEFAGGHLVRNEQDSLSRLEEECRTLTLRTGTLFDTFENIGNGLCRLHLAALPDGTDMATLNRFFVNSANPVRGSVTRFEEKLDVLRQCCMEKTLPYDLGELNDYLAGLKSKGYPPVGHSAAYRAAYAPAYRVVQTVYRDFFDIFTRIETLRKTKEKVYVAIDGGSAAGKTTLAALIQGVYDCNVFHLDNFFLRPWQRTVQRLKEPGGNVDYERFNDEVIAGLKSGRAFEYRAYDCRTQALGAPILASPRKLNIIEGAYSMHPALIGFYDLKIYIQIQKDAQSARIIKRNGKAGYKRFSEEWIPLEDMYFKETNTADMADLLYHISLSR